MSRSPRNLAPSGLRSHLDDATQGSAALRPGLSNPAPLVLSRRCHRLSIRIAATMLGLTIVGMNSADLRAGDPLEVRFDKNGLQSLSYQQVELLKSGQPRVTRAQWDFGDPEYTAGSFVPES